MRYSRTRRTMIAASILGAVVVGAATWAWADSRQIRAEGPAVVYGAGSGNPLTDTSGEVRVHPTSDGKTIVALRMRDFAESAEGRTFGAHVHTSACGTQPGDSGGHYRNPAAAADVPLHDREIWLDFTVNHGGNGRAQAVADWVVAPGAAKAVVIHAQPTNSDTGAAGARLACFNVDF